MKIVTGQPATRQGGSGGPDATRADMAGAAWARLDLRVTKFRFAFLLVLGVGLVAAGQVAEDLSDSPPLQMLPPTFYLGRWTVVVAALYMLTIVWVVNRTVQQSLPLLQRIVRIDDASFRAYALRMKPQGMRTNLGLIVFEALVVTFLFAVAGSELPLYDGVTHRPVYLPGNAVLAVAVLAGYTALGWSIQTLINVTFRLGRALGGLSREPFDIDVFDTTNLLPFGNMALAVSLAPTGIIFILLLGLGQPGSWLSWSILLLAGLVSVLALLLPLRGIHHQMVNAKLAALAAVNDRISQAYDEATGPPLETAQLAPLNLRTNTLVPLRKTIQEMTTWPFRGTVAFGRAVLIASAPLIYAALGELIKVIWINPLSRP